MPKQFYFKQFSLVLVRCLNGKTVPSQSTQFNSTGPIDKTLSDATTPIQSGPESDGNKGVLHIP